jgi:hypothetical protein
MKRTVYALRPFGIAGRNEHRPCSRGTRRRGDRAAGHLDSAELGGGRTGPADLPAGLRLSGWCCRGGTPVPSGRCRLGPPCRGRDARRLSPAPRGAPHHGHRTSGWMRLTPRSGLATGTAPERVVGRLAERPSLRRACHARKDGGPVRRSRKAPLGHCDFANRKPRARNPFRSQKNARRDGRGVEVPRSPLRREERAAFVP